MSKEDLFASALILLSVSLGYLFFLCALDIYFVVYAGEVRGWYNTAAFLVFTLPITLAAAGFKFLSKPQNVVFAFVSAPIGLAIAYFELLWVATTFHTLIGGTP
ncbi:MAG: hypothetical protein AAF353_10860 [Pseudomonadota bacterium]